MSFPVDIHWIRETELKLGVRFPAAFVVAMTKVNGGAIDLEYDFFWLHPFLDKSERKRIQRTCNSICRETATLREFEYFPKDLVSIGHNSTGDALVLKPMVENPTVLEHAVYRWDLKTLDLDRVADDFADLHKQ